MRVLQKSDRQGSQSLSKSHIKKQLKKDAEKSSLQSLKSLLKHGYLSQQQD